MSQPPEMQWGEWPTKIGEYIIAFGALEQATADYLQLIERDEELFHKILASAFSIRVERIQRYIDENRALTDEHKSALKVAWMRTVMLNALRLKLALRPSILQPPTLATDDNELELLWNPHLIELHVDFEEPQLMDIAELKAAIEQTHLTANELKRLLPLLG
jgi:hypothetical protein